jgi:predicted oxidoreductase (fatty acid repression mutant protein)
MLKRSLSKIKEELIDERERIKRIIEENLHERPSNEEK